MTGEQTGHDIDMGAKVIERDPTLRTAIATSQGCPYGRVAEQAIQAAALFSDAQEEVDPLVADPDEYKAGVITAREADEDAYDISAALLNCDTCNGVPSSVDFSIAGTVCEFALNAAMGNLITPPIIREYRRRVDGLGN